LEFENLVTLSDVCSVTQRAEMVERIAAEIRHYINELGNEGRLVSMQLEELMVDVEDEGYLIIRDYVKDDKVSAESVKAEIATWDDDELLESVPLGKILGYPSSASLDLSVTTRGSRILRKIPRLPFPVVENLVKVFGNLQRILNASTDELDEVEGIGEVRARTIKDGLRRLREQILLDRRF
jgi:diadenylate cyclase